MRAAAAAIVVLVGLADPVAAQRVPATEIRAVEDVIDAPHALFGRNRASIEAALGPPQSLRVRVVPGGRTGTSDVIDELTYPGVVLGVAQGPSGLRRVQIVARRWTLPHDINIGTSRALVEATLGEAQRVTDTSALYTYADGFPNTVELHFRDGRVHRIEWQYAPTD